MKKTIVSILLVGLLLTNTLFSLGAEETNKNQSETDTSCEGYTLLSDIGKGAARLIDMNGKEINSWKCSFPSSIFYRAYPFPAKMLTNGEVICGRTPTRLGRALSHATSGNSNLVQYNWNFWKINFNILHKNVLWNFNDWDDLGIFRRTANQHHDFQREGNPVGYYAPGQDFVPNGKTLILSHKELENDSIRKDFVFTDDVIYEVNFDGELTGFTWYATDHFDEMGFDEAAKKGIRNHTGCKLPGVPWESKIGLMPFNEGDWLHINSVSELGKNKWYDSDPEKYWYFHPENLIIDSRHANFIAIISRENGSIVWRVGPDYSDNTIEGQKIGQIIGPHNAHMIPYGLPGNGSILVFDNGGASGYGEYGCPNKFRNYSRVIQFNPVTKEIEWEYSNIKSEKVDETFLHHWKNITRGEDHHFFSPYVSSAQRLPNGNTLITEGISNRVFEVTPNKNIVWDYTDLKGGIFERYSQFYRAYRIPPEWVPGNPSGYPLWENNN
jgi:hypothetical protein